MIGKPHIEEWYRKEFICRMQNQGKLPKYTTEAADRKEQADFDTHGHIFPGAYGKDSALAQMLQQTGDKIAAGKAKTAQLAAATPGYMSVAAHSASAAMMSANSAASSAGSGSAVGADDAASTASGSPARKDRTARNALKARLAGLEQQLGSERRAREESERQLYNLSRGLEGI